MELGAPVLEFPSKQSGQSGEIPGCLEGELSPAAPSWRVRAHRQPVDAPGWENTAQRQSWSTAHGFCSSLFPGPAAATWSKGEWSRRYTCCAPMQLSSSEDGEASDSTGIHGGMTQPAISTPGLFKPEIVIVPEKVDAWQPYVGTTVLFQISSIQKFF